MGFFQTLGQGYKIMGSELRLGWQKHGSQFLTTGGTITMLISSIFMAKRGSSADVQKAIDEANAAIDEIQKTPVAYLPDAEGNPTEIVDKKQAKTRKMKLAKVKAKKYWTVGKHFWKEAAAEVAGAVAIGVGQHMNTVQKTALATACAAVSAEFAAYRANVIADQGEEKDLQYLTSKQKSGVKSARMEDGTVVENTDPESGDITVNADPNAFKFWCSPETCPSVYDDNLDMTKMNLECIENILTRKLRTNGHIYLNDMRREFGGLTPHKMDHPLGGIFGMTCDRNDLESLKKHVDLGWRKDEDFCDGRKVGVWIIFPCDPEPIVSKVNKKLLAVENKRPL